MNKDTAILIPSYEPDNLLISTVKSLFDEGFNILLVNDGSGDEYESIFDQVKEFVHYIKQPVNKGKGAALKVGFKNVLDVYPDTKFIITADGDGQHSTKDIIRVHDLLKEKNELVFGVRHFDKKVPFRSRFGNEWSKLSRSLLTKQYIADDQCGLRGFPIRYIDVLVKIKGNRYEYEMNQITLFQLKQYPIYPLRVETIYLDGNSKSHFSPFLDTCRIQSIILFHSIPSLISMGILIASLILCYANGLAFQNMIIPIIYTIIALIYYLIISLIYPSKMPYRRLAMELLFAGIRMAFATLLIAVFVGVIHLHYGAIIPISEILASGLNVLLAWAFRKIYSSIKK